MPTKTKTLKLDLTDVRNRLLLAGAELEHFARKVNLPEQRFGSLAAEMRFFRKLEQDITAILRANGLQCDYETFSWSVVEIEPRAKHAAAWLEGALGGTTFGVAYGKPSFATLAKRAAKRIRKAA